MSQSSGPRPRWQRLSVREGRAVDQGPFEGIPAHMKVPVDEWIRNTLEPTYSGRSEDDSHNLALVLHITGDARYSRTVWIRNAAAADEDAALDILDATLLATDGSNSDDLETLLLLGGSVWEVNADANGLSRRVSATEHDAFNEGVSARDAAAEQLRTAWAKVYGRQPDYSDAWDHAIKACEALLAPIVVPKSTTATLGSIISAIDAKPEKFALNLTSSHRTLSSVETFVGMLRLIWPNPDRHETGPSRSPTAEEARDVVHLAVTIVNWVRQGSFTVAP